MVIHPYLLARIHAIQLAFEQAGIRSVGPINSHSNPKSGPESSSFWDELLKDLDKDSDSGEGGGGGGGGGTMKGLRGKQHVAAMRRLGRR